MPFAIALFIGALIGLDREKRKDEGGSTGVGGIRTFLLIAMAGAIAAWLSARLVLPWIFLSASVCVTVLIVTGHAVYALRHAEAAHGLTTEIAAFVTFLLGGLALSGQEALAVALGIATSAILAYKRPIHQAVRLLSEDDVRAVLKLLIATFIVLPVLPREVSGTWGSLNPYKMWWLVILIAALSLAGYVASRWLGASRAIPLTGFFGGLASSTVVSLNFARRSREADAPPGWADSLASGLLLAWVVMCARIGIIVAAVNRTLLQPLWPFLAAMTAATVVLAAVHYRRAARPAAGGGGAQLPLRNPFSLTSAIKFALFFTAVMLVVKQVEQFAGNSGLFLVAGLAGLTDVDAITLSMAEHGELAGESVAAAHAIVIAAAANTVVKCGLVLALGSPALKRRMALATLLILAATASPLLLR